MANLCKSCGEEVKPTDARFAGEEPEAYWHFDCWDAKRKSLDPLSKRLEKMTTEMKAHKAYFGKVFK